MAKRRKETTEEDELDFKIPEFDEEAFVKRERRNIKVTVISFVFGIIIALISLGFWAVLSGQGLLRWVLILMVGILMAPWLRYILLRLNIDFTGFGKKGWFTTYATYFFAWLIVLIILCNPPFYDDESPHMDLVKLPEMQELGGSIKIIAKITDNVGIKKDTVKLEIIDPDGNKTTILPTTYDFDGMIISYIFENTENKLGEFDYTLSADDVNGKTTVNNGSFSYDENLLEIASSHFENLSHGDDISIEVNERISAENFRVYYRLNNGDEINVDRKYKDIKEEYVTSPKYKGWEENTKYNMTIYAEVSHYFTNFNKKYSNIITGSAPYKFSTSSDSKIGTEDSPMPWNWSLDSDKQAPVLLNYDHYNIDKNNNMDDDILLPHPNSVRVPGFEAIAFIASLVIVALIFKYKKKDRRNQK